MDNETALDYRFTVRTPADAHRAQVVSDLMESSPNPMRFECCGGGGPYSGRLQVRTFGGLGLMECQLDSPAGGDVLFVSERVRPHISRNHSLEYIVSIWLGGENELNTLGQTHTGLAGDFTVTSTENPFCVRVPNRGHACNLSLPASWDRIGDTRLEEVFGRLYSGDDRRHQGLADYARHLLARPDALALPGAAERLRDVIALALNPRAKSEHQAGFLALIRNHVDGRAADPGLSPGRVAASFDISVRYLHRLFASSGTTFTEYLIEQRLARAQQLLADPRCRHQKILAIAYDCGFQNVNHFGLRFRLRFGLTPGEFRHRSGSPPA
jgi:AraC-like DNA-binding protein